MRKRNKKNKASTMNTLVDVVIPVHGQFDFLDICLKNLSVSEVPFRVIIVDNNSPKIDADSYYGRVHDVVSPHPITVLRNKDNPGFPASCNFAASRGFSPLIFFLNSDVFLRGDSLDVLVKSMDDPKVGVAGMKLNFPDFSIPGIDPKIRPPGRVQHVGLSTNIRGEFYHHFVGWHTDNPKVNAVREVYAVTGAALLTRRSIWNQVKGFDLAYGLGTYEDVDYCLSVQELGYNVIVETQSVGVHIAGGTQTIAKLPFPLQRNGQIFLSKWTNKLLYTEWRVL